MRKPTMAKRMRTRIPNEKASRSRSGSIDPATPAQRRRLGTTSVPHRSSDGKGNGWMGRIVGMARYSLSDALCRQSIVILLPSLSTDNAIFAYYRRRLKRLHQKYLESKTYGAIVRYGVYICNHPLLNRLFSGHAKLSISNVRLGKRYTQ
jgi:hypothetical protein